MAIPKVVDQRIIDENFVKWNIPRPDKDYRVVVHCSTYKHESYIEDALKGFVMQKTNFPFCAIVIDDGSPDRTPAIIKQYAASYPDIIKPILLGENHMQHGMSRNPYFEEWHKRTKYIAMCEGDDYWTDPHKLQKQVDFLEEHQNYSFTFHKAVVLQKGEIDSSLYAHLENRDYSAAEIYDVWSVPTASVVYRRTMCGTKRPKHVVFGDILLFLNLLDNGLAYCMDFTGSVYRRHSGGISYSISYNLAKELFYQYREMESLFPNVRKISQRKKCEYLEYLIWDNAKSDVWKFRFYYMWLHKHLFLSSFFTTTIISYMLKPLCKSICNR